jgi:osmotically-inducible protein OsmY
MRRQPDYAVISSTSDCIRGNEAIVLLVGELKRETLADAVSQIVKELLGPQSLHKKF